MLMLDWPYARVKGGVHQFTRWSMLLLCRERGARALEERLSATAGTYSFAVPRGSLNTECRAACVKHFIKLLCLFSVEFVKVLWMLNADWRVSMATNA